MKRAVVLMTDFGLRDPYVGMMKGAVHTVNPEVQVIDLLHDIAAQDIREAAFHVLAAYRFFAPETVFCCVVDPGVGSGRRAIAVEYDRYFFVCPDNGILSGVLTSVPNVRAVELDDPVWHLESVSKTFHGRDIFAPVAAHIAAGVALEKLGTTVEPSDLVRQSWFTPRTTDRGWRAEIIHIDRFGNILTNLPGRWLSGPSGSWRLRIGDVVIDGISSTFSDVEQGMMLTYIGSTGYLEAAVRDGNAAHAWGVRTGESLWVEKI